MKVNNLFSSLAIAFYDDGVASVAGIGNAFSVVAMTVIAGTAGFSILNFPTT